MKKQTDARTQIAQLIEKYESLSERTRQTFNEANTRKDFVIPLFAALGWDVRDTGEVAEEVRVGRDYADYAFKLGGVTRFYVEAKALHVDLEDKRWAEQAVSYAYNKGVSWAILTNFMGLKLFCTDWDETEVNRLRVLDLHYDEYLDAFDDLWALSKPGVKQDRLRTTFERRSGAVRRRQPVGERLFGLFKEWRLALINLFVQYQPPDTLLRLGEIDEAVQRILDRLVFIRTLEDRRIEDSILLPIRTKRRPPMGKRPSGSDAWTTLRAEFRRLNDIYDSNLFEPHLADELEADESVFLDILAQLYSPDGVAFRFDFSAIEADVLGRVYEQYLGHVIETTKKEVRRGDQVFLPGLQPANVEAVEMVAKQAKRKQQGIYYTPKYIVDYIVEQTLGRLLDERGHDPEFVENLTVLDPACGSGSFLIAAYQRLLEFYAEVRQVAPEHLDQDTRIDILLRHIYGVDLDPQAVEIARLNLLLKALKSPQLLPELDNNIVRGNSLIGGDAETLEGYFGPDWRDKRPLNWEERFPHIMAARRREFWFVTFVTHNSRVSERMVTFGVETDEPLVFSPDDQLLIAEQIAEACRRHDVPVVALNVLPDHVHMVIAAVDEKTLNEVVRKIKGYSSHAFQQARGWPEGQHVWARKFNRKPLPDEKAFHKAINYINKNHYKHAERWGDGLIATYEGPDSGLGGNSDSGLKPTVSQSTVSQPTSDKGPVPRSGTLKPLVSALCLPPEEAVWARGGFDVVIGNPPWLMAGYYVSEDEVGYLRKRYLAAKGKFDLYYVFLELGLGMITHHGTLGMIVPNKFFHTKAASTLRRVLSQPRSLRQIVDFGDTQLFEGATNYSCILIFQSAQTSKPRYMRVKETLVIEDDFEVAHGYIDERPWQFVQENLLMIFEHMDALSVPLVDMVEYFGAGVQTGADRIYMFEASEKTQVEPDLLRPILRGRDIRRYAVPDSSRLLLFPYEVRDGEFRIMEEKELRTYRHAFAYLQEYRDKLSERIWFGKNAEELSSKWYGMMYLQPYAFLESPHLLTPSLSNRSNFTVGSSDLFVTGTAGVISIVPSSRNGESVFYLLGLLNSSLISLYAVRHSPVYSGGYYKFSAPYLKQLPIRRIDFDDPADVALHDRVVAHVEALLALHARLAALPETDERREVERQIAAEDAALDALVYELYGLTEEEIAIVEGA